MHHDAAGEVVELVAGKSLDPALKAEAAAPDRTLKTGYTRPTTSAVAATCGPKRARSAIPPETMAGIAAAKVSRKKNLTSS